MCVLLIKVSLRKKSLETYHMHLVPCILGGYLYSRIILRSLLNSVIFLEFQITPFIYSFHKRINYYKTNINGSMRSLIPVDGMKELIWNFKNSIKYNCHLKKTTEYNGRNIVAVGNKEIS